MTKQNKAQLKRGLRTLLENSVYPNRDLTGIINQILELTRTEIKKHGDISRPRLSNNEYQCEHVKQDVIDGACIWCELTVALKGLAEQKKQKKELFQRVSEQKLYDLTLEHLGRLDGKTTKLIKAILDLFKRKPK